MAQISQFPRSTMLHPASIREARREKKTNRLGVRAGDTLKDMLSARAAARNLSVSEHMLDLAVADLDRQRKQRRTLFDVSKDMVRAAELAGQGIESDAQRLWVLRITNRFETAVLEAA